ncbi:MAG: hypothetical protein HYT34_00130 [Candidatus Ryanbacteria bacterium]|nr:hypothetical protein [Candidatus Ryanbacteria bacterium]
MQKLFLLVILVLPLSAFAAVLPPTLSIPNEGSLSGHVSIGVTGDDIQEVELFLTDAEGIRYSLGFGSRATAGGWVYDWDTTTKANGSYTLGARVTTLANIYYISPVPIIIKNELLPPPPPPPTTDTSDDSTPPPPPPTLGIMPGMPSNPSPADDSRDVPLFAVMNWTPGSNTKNFDVYFGISSPPVLRLTQITNPSYTPDPLREETTYYWRVVAWNDAGITVGPIWRFRTKPFFGSTSPPPPSPTPPPPAPIPTVVDLRPVSSIRVQAENPIHGDVLVEVRAEEAKEVKIYAAQGPLWRPFLLGNATRNLEDQSRWIFLWDSTKTANGSYNIFPKITTALGEYGDSFQEVTVFNPPILPPPPPPPPPPKAPLPPPPPPPKEMPEGEEKEEVTKEEVINILLERLPEDSEKDTDHDGISDYDEVKIYATDPKKIDSNGDGVDDITSLLIGKNPQSAVSQMISYESPREAGPIEQKLFSIEKIEVTKVEKTKDGKEKAKEIVFRGKAPPNSIVTIYIFSTPIIVTVKADENGEWSYTATKDLPDGQHEIYVAVTNSEGKIVAKSDPVPFVKEAAAIEIGKTSFPITTADEKPSFFETKYLYLGAGFLLLALVAGIISMGSRAPLKKDYDSFYDR